MVFSLSNLLYILNVILTNLWSLPWPAFEITSASSSAVDVMTILTLQAGGCLEVHSLVPTSVSSGQNCWRTVSRCGQV